MALGLTFVVDRRRDRHLGHLDPRRLGRRLRRSVWRGRERLARGLAGARRRHRARPRQRVARRRARPALARGHARHARRLPRARVRDPRRAKASPSFPESFTELGGGYIDNELPVALARAGRRRGRARRCCSTRTRFGRYLFAIGSNREAARFSGIPVDARPRHDLRDLGADGRHRRHRLRRLLRVRARRCGARLPARRRHRRRSRRRDIFGGSGSMLGVFLALVLVAVLRNGMQLANIPRRHPEHRHRRAPARRDRRRQPGRAAASKTAAGAVAGPSRRKEVVRASNGVPALAAGTKTTKGR